MTNVNKIDMNTAIQSRYQRAQSLLQKYTANQLVLNATIYPVWIGESQCFWYERNHWLEESDRGSQKNVAKEYRLVNAQTKSNSIAFDHNVLANALADISEQGVVANNLPINEVAISLYDDLNDLRVKSVEFVAFSKCWVFDVEMGVCTELVAKPPEEWLLSPDGKRAVFTKNYNLWVRDLASGEERALTQDGEKFFIYGAPGTSWGMTTEASPQVQARWSPDSMCIYTVQRDTRQVLSTPIMHFVPKDGSVRPQLTQLKVAYPGDSHIETLQLSAIEVETGKIQRADYPQIPVTRNSYGFFTAQLGWWALDSRRAYFIDVSYDYKTARVVEFDTYTGATRVLFEEYAETHINLMPSGDEHPVFRVLAETDELVWFSERSGWGHLYLYDLKTGELKKTITSGEWLVRYIVHVDVTRREIYLQTQGRTGNRDPYYRDLVRVSLDSGVLKPLIASDHDNFAMMQGEQHTLVMRNRNRNVRQARAIEPDGNFSVVTRSRADEVPVSLLLDRNGEQILDIEVADISNLPKQWCWPEPVELLAADGKTSIYGLVYRPSDFNPDKSYPIISHGFNQPEIQIVAKGSFSNNGTRGRYYCHAAALAELGFIVVQIDGRGSPSRSKAFQDECYGSFQTASHIDDHVAGIKQLAERYTYMDLDRVGIAAYLSGGSGCVEGLLKHPDFFKVGVTVCLHDRRLMSAAMMSHKYEGVGGPSADHQYPEQLVEHLNGKLLLLHGMLDWCTPVAGVFRLIDALQNANKDFDLVLLPNQGRGCNDYMLRRAWDYFVIHLLDAEPPKNFKLCLNGFS